MLEKQTFAKMMQIFIVTFIYTISGLSKSLSIEVRLYPPSDLNRSPRGSFKDFE